MATVEIRCGEGTLTCETQSDLLSFLIHNKHTARLSVLAVTVGLFPLSYCGHTAVTKNPENTAEILCVAGHTHTHRAHTHARTHTHTHTHATDDLEESGNQLLTGSLLMVMWGLLSSDVGQTY